MLFPQLIEDAVFALYFHNALPTIAQYPSHRLSAPRWSQLKQ